MSSIINMIVQALQFISTQIMTIRIGGISLLVWITGIMIVVIVVNFVFKHSTDTTTVQKNRKRKNEQDE